MSKIKVMILKLHKKYYTYDDDELLKDNVAMENTMYQEVYGVIPKYDHNDYMMAVLRGTLKDTHVFTEYEFDSFEDDDILDFNLAFIKSDMVLYHIHKLTAINLLHIIKTINIKDTKAESFSISGNSILDLKTGDVKDNYFDFFFNETNENIKLDFDYKVRDLNEPLIQFRDKHGEYDEDYTAMMKALVKKDLVFKNVFAVDEPFDMELNLYISGAKIRKVNKDFKGFIVRSKIEDITKGFYKPELAYMNVTFSEELTKLDLKNYIIPKLILNIDLDDEFTIYNILQWLEDNWKIVRYINRSIPHGKDSYSIEVFNLLTPIMVSIIYGMNPNDDLDYSNKEGI
jgi:hypothetical protein